MKKIIPILAFLLMTAAVQGQIKIDMVLQSTPPANLTDWANRREVLTLLATGQPGLPPISLKIKAEIKTNDGTVIGTTDLARVAVFVFASSAPTILTATEVLPMENMLFTGKYKSSLQQTGKLPADNYTLCVQLVRPVDYATASNLQCKNFYLAAMQLPVLMKPYSEEILDAKQAQTAITFRWSPVSPRTTAQITYRIQVFEILNKQTPMQALRANQPLLDQEIRGATQYIWQPQMSFIWVQPGDTNGDGTFDPLKTISQHNHGFIWTIQSLDDHGLPVTRTDGNGEARSEPAVFYVTDKNQKQ